MEPQLHEHEANEAMLLRVFPRTVPILVTVAIILVSKNTIIVVWSTVVRWLGH